MYKKDFISYQQSIDELKKTFNKKGICEYICLHESLGRVLYEDIIAKENLPKVQTSAMDGYAYCYEENISKLTLLHDLPAGEKRSTKIKKGECIKTFTGSLMSEGSDTLIPIENVIVDKNNISIIKPVPKGFAVRPIGESYKKGEVLIEKGTKIGFGEFGVLSELGIVHVGVVKKPVIAIMATGSEIVDIGEELKHEGQIRSSNHLSLYAIAKTLGAEVLLLGIVKDDKELIREKILQALKQSDVIVTTGGVSVGDYDFVKDILNEFSSKLVLNGVAIKPGRHIKVLKVDEKYIFALPGFPYSAAVSFILYVGEYLKNYFGYNCIYETKAILDEDYSRKTPFTEFIACNLKQENARISIDFHNKKSGSSAIINNLTKNIAFFIANSNQNNFKKGDLVDILIIN